MKDLYSIRSFALNEIKENNICAEIGVWRGDYSARILKKNPKELHLIDPWVHQKYDWVKWAKGKNVIRAYTYVLNRFSRIKNVSIHRKNSTEINFGEEYFDWVYIDGDHSYNSVVKDLNHWWPQIKVKGFLCGDDYGWSHKLTQGPKPAVDEFVKKHDLKLKLHHNQFVIQKISKE